VLRDPTHSADFHLVGPLKQHLSRQRFVNYEDDNDVAAVMTWLQVLDQDFFAKGFGALVSCWDRCLNKSGDM
jgi:hypothetical protein